MTVRGKREIEIMTSLCLKLITLTFTEGFISPTSSLEDLSSELLSGGTGGGEKTRAKWKLAGPQLQNNSANSQLLQKFANQPEQGPKKMKACVKLWQTDGVSTRLFFAPNGAAMAASGAHNSVQV